ncbi:MAG: N-acetyl-gamma-glutamyl-phosphate reductase [Granulosicoccaceae bacterium]
MAHKIGIIGGSGYTGVELLRLLLNRTDVNVTFISSRTHQGTRVDALFPSLRGACELEFTNPAIIENSDCDLVFFATPNGTAMKQAPGLLKKGVKVIDLSADFRLKDVALFEQWYGGPHTSPEWLEKAIYGLTEINRSDIATAELVANPGCYPTAAQLGFIPLLEQNWVHTDSLIADAKSGVTGAGRGAQVPMLMAEAADNFKAYAVNGHRHLPEIEQGLNAICEGEARLTFTPHLLPLIRGIHATLYARLKDPSLSIDVIQQHFEARYADEPFVDVLPQGSHPETRSVRGSNLCRIAVLKPQNRDTVVVLAVEDNLVKGAAGQAAQNMNLMLGLSETAGLGNIALSP